MRKENGFTLIEMMVVIAIVGILSAFAIMNYNKRDSNLRAAAASIQTDLAKARSWAIRDNVFVVFQINGDGSGYTIFVDDGPNIWTRDVGERFDNVVLPAGILIDIDPAKTDLSDLRTRFDGRGYATNKGIVTLSPAFSNNKWVTIDMNNRFGRTKFKLE